MRSAALPLVALLFSTAASAQLTLLPQVGIDRSRTTLNYNDVKAFAPLGGTSAPRASVRLDYRLKGGHGPFMGIATSPAPVDYRFADPVTGATVFRAGTADPQWRLEGGWQYSSKPITFKHRKAAAAASTSPGERTEAKTRCGSYSYKSHCTSKNAKQAESRAWNLRVQPFAGVAYIPSVKEDLSAQAGSYTYKAGNWNTALLGGTGLEFGRGNRRLFTLSVQYLKGLGNLEEQKLVTESDGKTTVTRLRSEASAWSVGLGLPFTLAGKKAAPQKAQKPEPKSKCGEYREYRYKCTRKVVI